MQQRFNIGRYREPYYSNCEWLPWRNRRTKLANSSTHVVLRSKSVNGHLCTLIVKPQNHMAVLKLFRLSAGEYMLNADGRQKNAVDGAARRARSPRCMEYSCIDYSNAYLQYIYRLHTGLCA